MEIIPSRDERLEALFLENPEQVYQQQPHWLMLSHPEWMKKRNSTYFKLLSFDTEEGSYLYVKNNLQEVTDFAPRWILENLYEYYFILAPVAMINDRMSWCMENHAEEVCKKYPNYVSRWYPHLVMEHNPEWMRIHNPLMHDIVTRSTK